MGKICRSCRYYKAFFYQELMGFVELEMGLCTKYDKINNETVAACQEYKKPLTINELAQALDLKRQLDID